MTILEKLLKEITTATDKFGKAIPSIQLGMAADMDILIKDLEIKNGKLVVSAKNIAAIGKIQGRLRKIVFSPEYKEAVKDLLQSFDTITKLQNQYFESVTDEFKPTDVLKELRKVSIDITANSLTEAGINASVIDQAQKILQQNITGGASFSKLNTQMRDFLTDSDSGLGALSKYTKQITTDALNQYSAQYTQLVSADLGLEWFMYTGALTSGSRALCQALIKKKYIHISEFHAIIRGDFPEFKEVDGTINPKTKLPYGMIPGTNVSNFQTYRGGYQCEHQLSPVPALTVPLAVRGRFD